jgi:hypothetical protein
MTVLKNRAGPSRGKKQRLTVARAVFRQPPIKQWGAVRKSHILWVGAIALGALLYVALFVNPFPRDEELIDYFKLQQAELEQLVRGFRNFKPPTDPESLYPRWDTVPETKTKMEKIRVKRILEHGSRWLPNPYSIESARLQDKLSKEWHSRVFQQYGALKIFMADDRFDKYLLFNGWLEKGLYHIPEIPKVENGKIMSPVDPAGRSLPTGQVLSSLDISLWEWKKGECKFRQIVPHWYLFLCKAY